METLVLEGSELDKGYLLLIISYNWKENGQHHKKRNRKVELGLQDTKLWLFQRYMIISIEDHREKTNFYN